MRRSGGGGSSSLTWRLGWIRAGSTNSVGHPHAGTPAKLPSCGARSSAAKSSVVSSTLSAAPSRSSALSSPARNSSGSRSRGTSSWSSHWRPPTSRSSSRRWLRNRGSRMPRGRAAGQNTPRSGRPTRRIAAWRAARFHFSARAHSGYSFGAGTYAPVARTRPFTSSKAAPGRSRPATRSAGRAVLRSRRILVPSYVCGHRAAKRTHREGGASRATPVSAMRWSVHRARRGDRRDR